MYVCAPECMKVCVMCVFLCGYLCVTVLSVCVIF